jgi:hypothetical protein
VNRWGITHERAQSWVGHLNAIRLGRTFHTALIVEDDVEWDTAVRDQMPTIATAVREFSEAKDPPNDLNPYGKNWDVLWLGHCGELSPSSGESLEFVVSHLSASSALEENEFSEPEVRRIYRSTSTICPFAYALSSRGMDWILKQQDHGKNALDVWLHIRCKEKRLRCFTISPELFRRHDHSGISDSTVREQLLQ